MRARGETQERSSDSGTHSAVMPATAWPESVGERTMRIDRKITIATLVLERIPPADPRARLLSSAMLRRDEVLLDAVLAQITGDAAIPPSNRPKPAR